MEDRETDKIKRAILEEAIESQILLRNDVLPEYSRGDLEPVAKLLQELLESGKSLATDNLHNNLSILVKRLVAEVEANLNIINDRLANARG